MTLQAFKSLLGGAALALTLLTGAVTDARAEAKSAVIAVIDVQQIMAESSAAVSIQKQLDSQREVYQKEISSLEDKLRSGEQELGRQRTVLSQDAFEQKRKDFEKHVGDFQRNVQNRRRQLDQALVESTNTVRTNLIQIVADVAKEEGATVVLNKNAVVIVEKSLDLTAVVMERLNKKLPQVAVTIPK